MKDSEDQLDRKLSIDYHARFLVNTNRCVALDRDERAELFIGQLRHCLGQIMDGLSLLARQRENWMSAKRSQATPQLRLENDD